MDTLGDPYAHEDDYRDDEPAQRGPVMNQVLGTESLAVASLVLSVCSFFAGGFFQFLYFVVSGPGDSATVRYLLSSAPTALFSALAVALGVAVARRAADRWTSGVAGAGISQQPTSPARRGRPAGHRRPVERTPSGGAPAPGRVAG